MTEELKKKLLETAAKEDELIEETKYSQEFIYGATWLLKNIWHNICEEPDDDKLLLVIDKNGSYSFSDKDDCMRYNRKPLWAKWCYVDDISPKLYNICFAHLKCGEDTEIHCE